MADDMEEIQMKRNGLLFLAAILSMVIPCSLVLAQTPATKAAATPSTWDQFMADYSEQVSKGQSGLGLDPKIFDKYSKMTVEWSGSMKGPEGDGNVFTIGMPPKKMQPKANTAAIVVDEITVQPAKENLERWKAVKVGTVVRFKAQTSPMSVVVLDAKMLKNPTEQQKAQPKFVMVVLSDAVLVSPK